MVRRRIALDDVQAQTHRNAIAIGEGNPEAREKHHQELRRTASDPELARRYLLRTSMIESLRGGSALAEDALT